MDIAEAIRVGAKLRPQCSVSPFGNRLWEGPIAKGTLGSCALGAALEALGMKANKRFNTSAAVASLRKIFGDELIFRQVPHPEEPAGIRHPLIEVIWNLNDNCHWTREAIADWLDSEILRARGV